MITLTVIGFVLLFLLGFVAIGIYDEGRTDLRHGVDGHAKMITGVCLTVLAAIGAISLLVVTVQ